MPNGGLHHCGNCQHIDRQTQMCSLRNIRIEITHWTTCRDMDKSTDTSHGPVYSIVCEVKNGAGSYGDIPWFQGNRVDTVQASGGGDTVVVFTDRKGERHEFPSTAYYMEFWAENTPKEEQ